MNCEQFRDIAHDLLRDEALDAGLVDDAFAHAEHCDVCDALFEQEESLMELLRLLAARHASEQASPRVEEALLRTMANRQVAPRSANNRRRLLLASVAGIAAAAALLVAFVLPHGATHPVAAPQTQASPASPAEPSIEPGAVVADSVAASGYATSGDDQTAAGSFVPLTGTFDPSSLDEAMVVRVVLSHAALESFGLPASENGDEQVVADLVVANDGMPQAIRVVGW